MRFIATRGKQTVDNRNTGLSMHDLGKSMQNTVLSKCQRKVAIELQGLMLQQITYNMSFRKALAFISPGAVCRV